MGATDQPRYNGFRVIRDRVITALQCIVKISEKLNKRNLLKICLQVIYPTYFCIIGIHFYYAKKWKNLIF